MRVLVFCPTNELFGVTLQSIFRLEWDGPLDIWFGRDNPYGDRVKDIIYSYERGRQVFMAGAWEAMLTVESDMVVPPNALRRLVETGADVAYGLYCWRDQPGWNAYVEVREEGWPGHSITEEPDRAREGWGQVIEVTGLGFGCTLIRRPVLEAVEFHLDDEQVPDSMLAREAIRQGWTQRCDLNVVCGHVQRPMWVLWPDLMAEGMRRRTRL